MVETDTATGAEGAERPIRDEEGALDPEFVERVCEALERRDGAALRELVGDLHESDLGDVLQALEPEQREELVRLLGPDFDWVALTEVDDSVRSEILEAIPNEKLAEVLRDLDSDDAVEIIADLDEEDREAVLAGLPFADRIALERSLDYPEDSAGRRMRTKFIAVPPFWTVGQTIDFMREDEGLPDEFTELFVVDPRFRLIGTVPLDKLLRSKRPVRIADIMRDDPDVVRATDDQEDVARVFQHYNLVSAAVTDESGRLVGVIMIDDIVDVIEEEADEDLKALGGVNAEEELSDDVLYTVRSRFPWLLANMVAALVASGVIRLFEDSIERMIALAVLMPIVASMGGNAGTQALAVAVRAIAARDLTESNALRYVLREVLTALSNGAIFALVLAIVVALWFHNGLLAMAIALAVLINFACAGLAGILVPLTLRRFGADPAVSSSVFVTFVTDTVGFLAFLGLATMILLG